MASSLFWLIFMCFLLLIPDAEARDASLIRLDNDQIIGSADTSRAVYDFLTYSVRFAL
jgi:hypothetical protein